MTYVQGPHKNMSTTSHQAIKVYMPSRAKEKGLGLCNFTGKEDNLQGNGKSKCLIYKCLSRHAETRGHSHGEGCEHTGLLSSPHPAHHTWPTFLVVSLAIALFMDLAFFLNSVRQLRKRKKFFQHPLGFDCH